MFSGLFVHILYLLLKVSIMLGFALNSGQNSPNWPVSLQVLLPAVLVCLFSAFFFLFFGWEMMIVF